MSCFKDSFFIVYRRNSFSQVLFIRMLACLALVDTINGYLFFHGTSALIGTLFKGLIIVLSIMNMRAKNAPLIIFTLIYVSLYLSIVDLNSTSENGSSISILLKFLSNVFCYFAMISILRNHDLWTIKNCIKAFVINALIIAANISMGLFGVGVQSYSAGFGWKGFIISHNELGGMMAVLYGVVLYCLFLRYYKRSNILLFFVSILLLFTSLLLGTKTGILLVSLSILIIYYCFSIRQGIFRFLLNISQIKLLFAILLIFSVCYGAYVILDETGAIDHWLYFYELKGADAMYSGRDEFWAETKKNWDNANVTETLLGLGGARSVELDHYDALLNFGYIGTFFVYLYYLYTIKVAYHYKSRSLYAKFVFYLDLLILCASSFAGHLLFSGLMGVHYAVMNALVRVDNRLVDEAILSQQRKYVSQ